MVKVVWGGGGVIWVIFLISILLMSKYIKGNDIWISFLTGNKVFLRG